MMPCLFHADKSSPSCKQCTSPSKKNGFHRQSGSTGEDTLESPLAVLKNGTHVHLSPSSVAESECIQHQQCLLEGEELIQKLEKKPGDLDLVSKFVQKNKETLFPLKTNGIYLRICDLNGTNYMGQKYMLEGWQHLYLERSTQMEILGTLECSGSMATTLQWIILVAEDGNIYAYEDEELHVIASSLRELVENGIQLGKSHPYPHDVSDEESFQEDEDIQVIKRRTKGFVDKHADDFDTFLDFLKA
ncbi:uncharacterized protein LOC135056253 [Pseudophryne corroboree]|uniref:uncharacterized protein LOC135056253 n=1 Tax=Pseudophryne corroboree TaxID=495146 RepID=UPI0030820927